MIKPRNQIKGGYGSLIVFIVPNKHRTVGRCLLSGDNRGTASEPETQCMQEYGFKQFKIFL